MSKEKSGVKMDRNSAIKGEGMGLGIGFHFFLDMACCVMIYHIQKDSMKFGCLKPSKIMFDFGNSRSRAVSPSL